MGSVFKKLGGEDKAASEQARAEAAGRLVLEAGRKNRAAGGRTETAEAKALERVLALFEDGLIEETEADIYFKQVSF